MNDVTFMLQAVERGERQASEDLLPLLYDELRRLAAARMAREAAGHTLQPTALVHEAWMKLIEADCHTWENRGHFFAAASEAMRRILIDRARRKARLKHGGGQERLNIEDLDVSESFPDDNILLLDEALERLKVENPETAQVVTLKFFGGLTFEEIAKTTGVNVRTVMRKWSFAKMWLFNEISEQRSLT